MNMAMNVQFPERSMQLMAKLWWCECKSSKCPRRGSLNSS